MIVTLLLFLAILLGFSAFFSGSETALFSLSRFSVEKLKQRKPSRGEIISRLLARPRRLLISIVIGNMLVNILSSALAERLSFEVFASSSLQSAAWIFSTVVMTFIILIFCEVGPKVLAINRSEKISLAVAPEIFLLQRLVTPLRVVFQAVSDFLISCWEEKKPHREIPLTREELETALDQGSREGTLNGDEKEMISEIFKLGNKSVRQLMTPRNEIASFEIDTPLEEIVAVIREKEYSRIPIYSGKMENVVGILYPKDLLIARVRGIERPVLADLLRRPYFIPETMKASRLLKEFLARKIHIALVVDEYGGIAGLITLDDLVEEIIGEIRERGEVPPGYEVVGEDTVQLPGRLELDYLNDEFRLDLRGENNVTLGGFLSERLGHLPQPGDVCRLDDIRFTVVSVKKRRVDQVLLCRPGLDSTIGKGAK
jgi:putative hemolysin